MWQRLVTPLLPPTPVARFLCCVALMLAPACHRDGPDSPFKRYLNQLDFALAGAELVVLPELIAPPPTLGQWQVPIAPGSVEGLDTSRLKGCALQASIRKRQTALGQFAKPSQRLIMALEFLHQVPACIRQLRADSDHALADRLETVGREMQAQLPKRIFNATLGSEEYNAFWLATRAASGYPHSDTGTATAALESINRLAQRWLNGDYRVHNLELELLLSAVAGGEGGQALARWSRQIAWLATADRPIAQALATSARCGASRREAPPSRHITLAHSYFMDVIQPLTTGASYHYSSVTAPIEELEKHLAAALAPQYRHWLMQRNAYTAALADAPTQHLNLLRKLLPNTQPVKCRRDHHPFASRAPAPEIGYTADTQHSGLSQLKEIL